MKERIGIYCRVSSREQAMFGYGIDVQKKKIKEYINLFDVEYESIEYYVDDGVSAGSLNRKQMQRMIADIKQRKLDVVYIYKLDRLSRSVIDVNYMMNLFLENDCNIVAIMDNIDISTANGRFFVGILALVAQWERETDKERTFDGIEAMVKQGKYPYGSTPFGYDKTDDLHLVINEEEANCIRFIIEKACESLTLKEIERLIVEEFDLKKPLTSERIKEIILKPWYYGVFIFHGKSYENICPPLYSKEKAEEAQSMIGKRYLTYDDSRYYFGNKVRCVCGSILERKSTKKKNGTHYFYYVCGKCKKRINQNYLVEQSLYSISAETTKGHTVNNNIRSLRKLDRLNSKIQELHHRYINDKIHLETYVMALYHLEYEKNEQIAKIKTESLVDFVRWDQMDNTEKKQFIHNHIKNITVDVKARMIISIEYLHK